MGVGISWGTHGLSSPLGSEKRVQVRLEVVEIPNPLFLWSGYSPAPNLCTSCCSHSNANPCA